MWRVPAEGNLALYVCTFAEVKRLDILRGDKFFRTSRIKIDAAVKQRRLIGR